MQRNALTYFIDRSLGGVSVARALSGCLVDDEEIITHDTHFDQDVDDDVWLKSAGRQGWIALSKDDAIIRKNPPALAAILTYGVKVFVLTRQDMKGEHMGALFASALPGMRRIIAKYNGPFIVQINSAGKMSGPLTEKKIAQLLWEKHRIRL